MKISKDAASNIAYKLLKEKEDKLTVLRLEYRTLATEEYKSQIPKEVVDNLNKFTEYINTCTSLQFNSHGFNYEYIEATEQVIQHKNKNRNEVILNAKFADRMFKMKTKIDKLYKDYKTLFEETKNALLSLGTTKRIEANFPEAIPYLPVSENLLPIANLDDLRKKISSKL